MGWVVKSLITFSLVIASSALLLVSFANAESSDVTGLSSLKIDQISETPKLKKFEGEWKFALGARGQTEGLDEGVASFISLRAKTKYSLLENLSIHVNPRFDFYSSQIQQRYEDDLYQTKIRLTDAYVKYSPIEDLDLKFGAHGQGILNQEMIIAERKVFPGAQEILRIEGSLMRFEIMAQQLVPTGSSLNTERSEKEKIPAFFTESIKIMNKKGASDYQWEAQGGHYRWQGLSSKTAFFSDMSGNQTTGTSITDKKFATAFDGYFGSLAGCWCVSQQFNLSARFERVRNSLAPSSGADGQAWSLMPKLIFSDLDLSLNYWKYFIESDATVSEYVSTSTAGTNRDGQEVKFLIDLKKLGFSIDARWAQAIPINADLVQKTITEYYIGLESHYVAF